MNIIKQAIITEKTMKDAGLGTFSFIVEKSATKDQIKRQAEKAFGVNVTNVATVTQKGKTQRSGARRVERTTSSYKKAFITLKKGQKIGLFELGESK